MPNDLASGLKITTTHALVPIRRCIPSNYAAIPTGSLMTDSSGCAAIQRQTLRRRAIWTRIQIRTFHSCVFMFAQGVDFFVCHVGDFRVNCSVCRKNRGADCQDHCAAYNHRPKLFLLFHGNRPFLLFCFCVPYWIPRSAEFTSLYCGTSVSDLLRYEKNSVPVRISGGQGRLKK